MNSPPSIGTHFALCPCEDGIALLRRTAEGLCCDVSPDGLRWERRASVAGAESLWPVSTTGASFFCADTDARLATVASAGGGLSFLDRSDPVPGSGPWYEGPPDPRDMALVRDESAAVYHAFFSARRRVGRDAERRGCIGVATSRDLRTWTPEPPIFSPNLYPNIFSPHVLNADGRVTLFYATPESGDLRAIRFAPAAGIEGPFERDEPDLVACDARTALHTVPLRGRRLVFFGRSGAEGPGMTRPGVLDYRADGRPVVRFYDPLLGLLGKTLFQTQASLSSVETLVRVFPRYAGDFRLAMRIRSRGARAMGALFRASMTGHDNMTVWLDFAGGAVVVRRGVNGRLLARASRPLVVGETYRLAVWVEGRFADFFLDDEWVLTVEAEGRKSGGFGLAILGGDGQFDDIAVQTVPLP